MAVLNKAFSYNSMDDNNILSLINTTRKGISFSNFSELVQSSPFSVVEWAQFLNISTRTIQRYRKNNESFDPLHSEKIIQIVLLCRYGVEVFGTNDKFNLWLETQNVGLGQIKPKELLDTAFGINLIRDELTRIEHGILA